MKSFVINLINEYANWGDLEKMKLCKQSSSTATTLVLTALNATLFLLHITKRVKILKTDFLILFLVNLLGGWGNKVLLLYKSDRGFTGFTDQIS